MLLREVLTLIASTRKMVYSSMHNFKSFKLSFFFCFIILLISCKTTSRKILTSQSGNSIDSIHNYLLNPPTIDWINAKAKISVESSSITQKGTTYIRAKKDSVLWMLVKKATVEGGRVQIINDSIYAINRLEKTFYIKPLDYIQEEFGFNSALPYIHSLLAGHPPKIDSSKHWKSYLGKDRYSIETLIGDMVHQFDFDTETGLHTGGHFRNEDGINGRWVYNDYRMVENNIEVPFYRYFNIQLNENESIILSLDFSAIEINQEKTINFQIPSHYQRVY